MPIERCWNGELPKEDSHSQIITGPPNPEKGDVAPEHMAVGEHPWYHVGVGAPPSFVYFSGGLGCSLWVRDFDPRTHLWAVSHFASGRCLQVVWALSVLRCHQLSASD